MCGIFILNRSSYITKSQVLSVMGANRERGDRGYGLLRVARDGKMLMNKGKQLDPDDLDQSKVIPFADDDFTANFVAGHTLAPTGDVTYYHPLVLDGYYFAHNGIIHDTEKIASWQSAVAGLDSGYILGGILHHIGQGKGVADAIAATMTELKGQAGCWLYDSHTQKAYIWRSMSSIWYGMIDGVMTYSSAKIKGLNLMLPDGVVYECKKAYSPAPVAFYKADNIY